MLQSHSQPTNKKILFFQRFLLFVEFFYSTNLSFHNFFLSVCNEKGRCKLCLIREVKHARDTH